MRAVVRLRLVPRMSARALLGSLRRMEGEASEVEIEPPPPLESPPPLEEPEHLLCPIAFTLLWDPVMLRSGHTYERSSILRFWEGRPLANPIGGSSGAKLKSAQMIINYGMRAQVDAWLDAQPCDYVPSGWTQRPPPERRSTQDELDALSEAIEASAAREAAEAAAADAAAAALQEEDAAWQLAEAKDRICLTGDLPAGACSRRYLGVYETVTAASDGEPILVHGRRIYALVPTPQASDDFISDAAAADDGTAAGASQCVRPRCFLWFARSTRFWHFGPEQYVGQACGHVACYGPGIAVPERLPAGQFQVTETDGSWSPAPGLRVHDADEMDT